MKNVFRVGGVDLILNTERFVYTRLMFHIYFCFQKINSQELIFETNLSENVEDNLK